LEQLSSSLKRCVIELERCDTSDLGLTLRFPYGLSHTFHDDLLTAVPVSRQS
jgi:hypothetical protein